MKKLISLLAAVSVVSACSLAAFATDFTVDYDENKTEDNVTMTVTPVAEPEVYTKGANKLYNVDLTTVANGQAQTTILAVEGTTIKVGTIKYINQSGTPSFSFDMDDPSNTVYVLAGGSTLTPTLVGTIEAASTEPETFTISGIVKDYVGTSLPTVTVSDGTNNYTATVVPVENATRKATFTVDVPVLTEGNYTLKAQKLSYFTYEKSGITAAKDDFNITMYAGDITQDGYINIYDVGEITGAYDKEEGVDEGYVKANDLTEDGYVNIYDVGEITGSNYDADISVVYPNN